MDVQISWLAVILATISSMVVGSVWYAPSVFGNKWMKWAKVDPNKSEHPWRPLVVAVITSLVTAYVLAHVTFLSNAHFQNAYLQDALTTAFWVWLGFVATRFATHDGFEMRPLKLTALNIAHEFVTIMVMGLIIGLLQP